MVLLLCGISTEEVTLLFRLLGRSNEDRRRPRFLALADGVSACFGDGGVGGGRDAAADGEMLAAAATAAAAAEELEAFEERETGKVKSSSSSSLPRFPYGIFSLFGFAR